MGEMPVPGRLAVMLPALNLSPVLIRCVATSDLRAMGLFFSSLGLERFRVKCFMDCLVQLQFFYHFQLGFIRSGGFHLVTGFGCINRLSAHKKVHPGS
jgi:hypothetical protein